MDYAENDTAMWYSGLDLLNVTQQDVLSAAEFDWKQLAVSVIFSGLEQLQNSGKERVIDWLAARVTRTASDPNRPMAPRISPSRRPQPRRRRTPTAATA